MTSDVMSFRYLGGNGPGASGEHTGPVETARPRFGQLLRTWRQRRRYTQLNLALEAEVSARHLSFLENGRAKPSPQMVDTLAEALDVPLPQRNAMLLAAGLAPRYPATQLDDGNAQQVRSAVEFLLRRHHPYPSVVVDDLWNVQMANDAYVQLACRLHGQPGPPPQPDVIHRGPPIEGTNALLPLFEDPSLRAALLDAEAFARTVLEHLRVLSRTRPEAAELARRIRRAVGPLDTRVGELPLVIPIAFQLGDERLAMFSTMTMLGTSNDVVLSSMRIETQFPADAQSDRLLREIAGA